MWPRLKEKWLTLNQQFKAWHRALYRTRVLSPFRLSFIMPNDTEEAGGDRLRQFQHKQWEILPRVRNWVCVHRKKTSRVLSLGQRVLFAVRWFSLSLLLECWAICERETATFRRHKSFRHLWKVDFDFSIWIVIWFSEKNHKCFGIFSQ